MTEPREELEFRHKCELRAVNETIVLKEELAALVEDLVFKADLLRIAEKALEDIRALCISSMYWKNDRYPNCARILQHHHKIVREAKVKIAELSAIQYGDDLCEKR